MACAGIIPASRGSTPPSVGRTCRNAPREGGRPQLSRRDRQFMANGTLEAVLRRDRLIVAASLGAVAALAWAYVLWLTADLSMGGMKMSGFRMIPAGLGMMVPAAAPWSAVEFAFVFVMWAVMMVGMMAPSAAPMILLYAQVGRHGKIAGKPLAATGWFAAGYFLAWAGFSLGAT